MKSEAAKKSNKTSTTESETSNYQSTSTKNFPIVGMGGSAGSLDAFQKFFTHMPPDSGMAFVIVMHLDPDHKGNLIDILASFTSMKVVEPTDGTQVKANTIYLIPRNCDMAIHNRKLLLLPVNSPRGFKMPIDYFLQSLAEDQWNKAIGIIFSGMGSDGELGLRMIKEKFGMTMAQDPDSAQFSSMPKAAISTNLVDFVLPPEEMPIKLIQFINHPVLSDDGNEAVTSERRNSNSIQKILMMLRSKTGHDFTLYKKSTITRRIDRRIAFHQLPDYTHYVNFLRENPHELGILFNDLLIGVTKFFRDIAAFDSLKEKLIPILSLKSEDDPIRVWVAGCSTGEEAYSIAIILSEYLETLKDRKKPKVQIFATDLDQDAIEQARRGLYHDNIAGELSEERLRKFFVKKNDMFSVNKELREMIVFANHNLIKDAPFTRLDLLCCRNLMIYLTIDLQKKLIPIFHYSLNPNGLLFLGPAESIGGFTEIFKAIDPKWKLFQRKPGELGTGRVSDFPFHITKQHNAAQLESFTKAGRKNTIADTFNHILLEHYTPASILVNEKGDIQYINGQTSKYLKLTSGEAVMNVHRMAREEIRYALSNAIHQARVSRSQITLNDIKLKEKDGVSLVTLKVSYLDELPLQGLVLVVFEDKGQIKKASKKGNVKDPQFSVEVEELEKELIYTKQQLHTTIEQMETSLEELKSTNEELQSTNEELQSTNEESLTTKEEMQSLNEELMTINLQYQSKAEELTHLNNDMKNLLDSTEIGTIFVSNDLKILRFTPQVTKLFNLIPTDIGRSINHVVSNLQYENIDNDIHEVIDELRSKDIEIRNKDNDWYQLRILPYRTLDNFISGVVMTFQKITFQKQLEVELRKTKNYNQRILSLLEVPVIQLDSALTITGISDSFLDLFNAERNEMINRPVLEFFHKSLKLKALDKFFRDSLIADSVTTTEHSFPGIGTKKLTVSSRILFDRTEKEECCIIIYFREEDKK
jgi:two-component system, chemotaxis family, CheB/CheR fusion protein